MNNLNVQKMLMGAHLFWVEEGTVVDGLTVSSLVIPDVDPEENWQSMGCANDLTPFAETENDEPEICFDGNRYNVDTDVLVTSDAWIATLNSHNEFFFRMLTGIDNPIQDGIPMRVYETSDRSVYGFLKYQTRNVHSKGDVWVMNLWVKVTINQLPTYGRTTVKPQLRFTVKSSPHNIAEFTNVAGA